MRELPRKTPEARKPAAAPRRGAGFASPPRFAGYSAPFGAPQTDCGRVVGNKVFNFI